MIQIEPDPNLFWKSGQPPRWADDWGTDDYGHWVTFSVKGQQGDKITQRLRWIEPGMFLMGSPEDEPERRYNEGPQHPVTIRRGFWLFDTACTQALWEAVMGDNPSRFEGADHPVERVSWNDCQDFLNRLNAIKPGLDLSLPSEAQWEYACRAGTTTPFSFGDNITSEQVNYNGNYPYASGKKGVYRKETVPVASLPPNRWGLYEMHGNLWEWCQDCWHGDYQGAPADGLAWENDRDISEGRVTRGGTWLLHGFNVRSALRYQHPPDIRLDLIGFRCARVLEGAEPAGPAAGQPGGVTGAEPTLLRLDAGPSPVRCALPQTPAFFIRTDRERLTFRQITRPPWANAIGRDRFGLWSEIAVDPGQGEPIIQRLRWIPPGQFRMGSPEAETQELAKDKDERIWFQREHPRHWVTLTEGYWLFDTPCTQALWAAVMGNNPSAFQSPTRPVEQVSWEDIQSFLGKINEQLPGLDLTLPREAQWEYACRAGTETATYTGDLTISREKYTPPPLSEPVILREKYTPPPLSEPIILGTMNGQVLDQLAWYSGNSGVDFELANGYDSSDWPEKQYPHARAGTHPVKLKRANPWGLYDMLGNVWEWCRDGVRDYDHDAQTNPEGVLETGAFRVLRGGSWYNDARYVRAAYRDAIPPDDRSDLIGFRCVRVQS